MQISLVTCDRLIRLAPAYSHLDSPSIFRCLHGTDYGICPETSTTFDFLPYSFIQTPLQLPAAIHTLIMRLLQRLPDDNGFNLVEYFEREIPPYAILSHTWGPDGNEVTFKDLMKGTGQSKPGYRKLSFCCGQAAQDGLDFFWVDTCCIDKSSSSELTEAINSMFRWYQNSGKCYVYLSDVSRSGTTALAKSQEIQLSRWFKRGWTLQELLAPKNVTFFDAVGELLGDRHSLEDTIQKATGIHVDALRGRSLASYSIDERLSWMQFRDTKRGEDKAYSLLGIFDIQLPLIYGEGYSRALERLLKEIDEHIHNADERIRRQLQNLVRPLAPPVRLFHIKTQDTGGMIEVHVSGEKSSYAGEVRGYNSGFEQSDANKGTWTIDRGDLYFIKTKATGSGKIELHQTLGSSLFWYFFVQTSTAFCLYDADNGFWEVDNGSLYFIKTKNTGTGFVEVHRVDRIDWNSFAAHDVTDVPEQQAGTGTWTMHGGNLWWIQPKTSDAGYVKVSRWSGSKQYKKQDTTWNTAFTECGNGTWRIGPSNDLHYIKHADAADQRVEVVVATWESGFQETKYYETFFSGSECDDGVWCVG
jgi:hypothetical protein